MMRISIGFGVVLAMLWSLAEAQVMAYGDDELKLQDKSRACFMVFAKLYDAYYFRSEDGGARCVKLDYLRAFDQDELIEATEKIFTKLHGEPVANRFAEDLGRIAAAYQPVSPGASYQYCVGGNGAGEMIRDGQVVVRLEDPDFSERMMNIWVIAEEGDGKPRWNFSRCPGTVF